MINEKLVEHCRQFRDYAVQRSVESDSQKEKRLSAFYEGKIEAYSEMINWLSLHGDDEQQ